jgi:nucleotide-binding universal stress UspA family protein
MYRTVEQVELWQEKLREGVLAEALASIPSDGPEVTASLLRGPAVRTLLDHIQATAPDMVIMGRTGRGRLDRMLHGSVSRRVSALSAVPVTLVS